MLSLLPLRLICDSRASPTVPSSLMYWKQSSGLLRETREAGCTREKGAWSASKGIAKQRLVDNPAH